MDDQESRARYRRIYFVLGIVFSSLLALTWTSYILTQSFAKGTVNYAGALIAMASIMTSQIVNCFIVGKNVMKAGYDKQKGCCTFYFFVRGQAFYPGAIIVASIAVIVCSVIFGILYEQRVPEHNQVNNDANFIMGIMNLILGTCASIISLISLYYGIILKGDLDKAVDNQGPFANVHQDPTMFAKY